MERIDVLESRVNILIGVVFFLTVIVIAPIVFRFAEAYWGRTGNAPLVPILGSQQPTPAPEVGP